MIPFLIVSMVLEVSCIQGPESAANKNPLVSDADDSAAEQDERSYSSDLNGAATVSIDTLNDLIVYSPNFFRVELVCGEMPSKDDEDSVIFCAAQGKGTPFQDVSSRRHFLRDGGVSLAKNQEQGFWYGSSLR